VAYVPDVAILDEARKRIDFSLNELWLAYFAIGGKADRLEFEAFFHGLMRPDALEYNVLAHAVNEAFMDRGSDERMPYAE
jgi:hypothetical protein